MRKFLTTASEMVLGAAAAQGVAQALDWLRGFGLQYAYMGFGLVYVCAARVISTRRTPCSSN